MSSPTPPHRLEVLAPAGDEESLRAAVLAGADAVYFGLQGFNARARAKNFDVEALQKTLAYLHEHGVKGYVTLNTLVFDEELPSVEAAARACAKAGADAVIVQDFGVARLVRAVAPSLPIHASTQMTCTDAGAVELAREMGASRVILARELSLDDIAAIRRETDLELEVFVHGALCVAYSGQCLTSEALGGRSANRGACAQACRLPYELVVDGELRDQGDRAYLLSPEDLEASELVPRLMELGVSAIKIEGRLKGPAYVAATTRLYRAAIEAARTDTGTGTGTGAGTDTGTDTGTGTGTGTDTDTDTGALRPLRDAALQMFSRGSGPGFLAGVNHQRIVEGRACDHRGVQIGDCLGLARVRGRPHLRARLSAPIARGDGVLVEGGFGGEGEVGGRVWAIARVRPRAEPEDVERAAANEEVILWLGPDRSIENAAAGRRIFKTSDPAREKAVLSALESDPHRLPVAIRVEGRFGELPIFSARAGSGLDAEVTGDRPVERARSASPIEDVLRDKLGRLGDTPFSLGELLVSLPEGALIPASTLNRARRALTEKLLQAARRAHEVSAISSADVLAGARPPDRDPPPGGLFVLCRSKAQAEAALDAGADGIYLDFLELTGTGVALRELRAQGASWIGVAPPRIRKPGEEKIDKYLASLEPDAILVRGLGALREGSNANLNTNTSANLNANTSANLNTNTNAKIPRIGDFSLNVTNRLSAAEVLGRGLSAFTPSFDLDAAQLSALLDSPFGPWAEVVVHHPMPLFHMEHCVIAALLSDGKDYRDCGRPCDRHQVSLRDRAGMDHPVEADVGCRNTVFHAAAQSAAGIALSTQRSGVRRFRIELVRENENEVRHVVTAYRKLLRGAMSPADLRRALKTEGGYGVVTGSLRVMAG